jgi:hypothetical protein
MKQISRVGVALPNETSEKEISKRVKPPFAGSEYTEKQLIHTGECKWQSTLTMLVWNK